jgi:class 3 adenylate cyclase
VAALARPAEILVSRTVRDLLAGSEFCFADRGSERLGDSPDAWQLFAVDRPAPTC